MNETVVCISFNATWYKAWLHAKQTGSSANANATLCLKNEGHLDFTTKVCTKIDWFGKPI